MLIQSKLTGMNERSGAGDENTLGISLSAATQTSSAYEIKIQLNKVEETKPKQ